MLDAIKKFVEIKDGKEEELQGYLEGLKTDPAGVKFYLETEDGKKLLQPMLDKYHNKSLESWKSNNLDKLTQDAVDKAIAEKYPEETEEQKRLKRLESELASERKARNREALRNKAISEATAKGLPIDIVDHFLGDDEDGTVANINKLEQTWKTHLEDAVKGKFKDSGRKPGQGDGAPKTFTRDEVAKMSRTEVNENWPAIEQAMTQW